LQLLLRFGKECDADNGRRVAPDPSALRAIAAPGLEIVQSVLLLLTILGEHGLPIIVTCLTGIDAISQDIADCRGLPDRVLARGRRCFGGVQAFGDLTATQLFFHQGAIDVPNDGCFDGVDHHLRRAAVTFRQIVVAVTRVRPRDELAMPGFLQTSAPSAFGNLGALVLSNHPLHLRQQFALRTIAEGILEKDPDYSDL
jgi:hypothetical protein